MEVLKGDCDGVYVAPLVVLEAVLLEHRLHTGRDSRMSELGHRGEHVVLNLWRLLRNDDE